ncbi:N-6 DNA methylase [uncultured Thiodictyon sp.]|uniref:N-6 DNA methylase n=1 Tax=uncultured Thiodictyon sp. TaxID=1846217 RepID=UPI0025E8BCA2|nr:N-6 DNA methylase [uncultured Thiodictyon sp.]
MLFLALFLRLLKIGGRTAVIAPDGVLFGSSKAHQALRRMLVEEHKLDAVIKLPSGVFRPYAAVSTAILCFTKTVSAAPIKSGSMTCRPTATRWTTSATASCELREIEAEIAQGLTRLEEMLK